GSNRWKRAISTVRGSSPGITRGLPSPPDGPTVDRPAAGVATWQNSQPVRVPPPRPGRGSPGRIRARLFKDPQLMTDKNPGRRPLEGYRVLEMGQLLAGPFAGSVLAYFGAEVIKIEPPGSGDPIRKWRVLKDGVSLWWYS